MTFDPLGSGADTLPQRTLNTLSIPPEQWQVDDRTFAALLDGDAGTANTDDLSTATLKRELREAVAQRDAALKQVQELRGQQSYLCDKFNGLAKELRFGAEWKWLWSEGL